MPDAPSNKFARYRSKKRDELSGLREEVARLQDEVMQRDAKIDELRESVRFLTKLSVQLSAKKQESDDRLRWNRSDVERWLNDRIVDLEHELDAVRSLVLPRELALYGRNRLHSDREHRDASKPLADALFVYFTKHLELSEKPEK